MWLIQPGGLILSTCTPDTVSMMCFRSSLRLTCLAQRIRRFFEQSFEPRYSDEPFVEDHGPQNAPKRPRISSTTWTSSSGGMLWTFVY